MNGQIKPCSGHIARHINIEAEGAEAYTSYSYSAVTLRFYRILDKSVEAVDNGMGYCIWRNG